MRYTIQYIDSKTGETIDYMTTDDYHAAKLCRAFLWDYKTQGIATNHIGDNKVWLYDSMLQPLTK